MHALSTTHARNENYGSLRAPRVAWAHALYRPTHTAALKYIGVAISVFCLPSFQFGVL
jgi:hypothetical protein